MPTTTHAPLTGLYAITDAELIGGDQLLPAVTAALRGGARLIQYRHKIKTGREYEVTQCLREAQALRDLCHHYKALLIINDDIALAKNSGADGIHLGCDDASIKTARHALGEKAIIGVSCYNDFSQAQVAAKEKANYIAFGSFFPSSIKPNAPRADTTLLSRARDELTIPVCAIGGITPKNGRALVSAGANMLAVIHGLFGTANKQPAIENTARAYAALFSD